MAMVIPKGSVSMKKAGIFTIAVVLLAAILVLFSHFGQNESKSEPKTKGTLVKEYKEWKKYYI